MLGQAGLAQSLVHAVGCDHSRGGLVCPQEDARQPQHVAFYDDQFAGEHGDTAIAHHVATEDRLSAIDITNVLQTVAGMVDTGVPPLSILDRKRYCAKVTPPHACCRQTLTSFEVVVSVFNNLAEQLDVVLEARDERLASERPKRRFWVFWGKSDAEAADSDGVGARRVGVTTMQEWFEPLDGLSCLYCGQPASDDSDSAYGLSYRSGRSSAFMNVFVGSR